MNRVRVLAPALVVLAVGAGAAYGVHRAVPAVPALPLALGFGLLVANVTASRGAVPAGTSVAASTLLRTGVVLLGFQVAAGDVWDLGLERLAIVVGVVLVTFGGTRWLGARLGVSSPLSLLTAMGFAICGASAIAALRGVVDADDEEVTAAIGLVTLCGSLAIVVLPLLQGPLDLGDQAFGVWTGASVHDVGQVVATASTAGSAALSAAVVVKLTRVLCLAPLVAAVSLSAGRRAALPVPLFVLGFVTAIALRTSGIVPDGALDVLHSLQTAALTAALFGIGASTPLGQLRRLGLRPVLLGLLAWLLVAGVAYAGVRLT
jgi:uncharacterized integral membrane protein (TIGR00698 family)